ncbi:periodic tryptophan protein-like protein, partial [Trifolium medium]|nr:periodic tryptophan protein-like protein [Trifolium medium]
MIAAISWIPKGVSRAEPVFADPPSKEDIEEIISNTLTREEDENEEDDANKKNDEVA